MCDPIAVASAIRGGRCDLLLVLVLGFLHRVESTTRGVRLLQRHYRGSLFVGEKGRTVYGSIQRGFQYLSLRENEPHNASEDRGDD